MGEVKVLNEFFEEKKVPTPEDDEYGAYNFLNFRVLSLFLFCHFHDRSLLNRTP